MYLHLGQSVVVPEANVIGVFDLDKTSSSRITRWFLSGAEKSGRVVNVSDELPNSFVVCGGITGGAGRAGGLLGGPAGKAGQKASVDVRGKTSSGDPEFKVYLSQLSSQTLYKRSGTIW